MRHQADLEPVSHVHVAAEGYLVSTVQRGRPEVSVEVGVVQGRNDEVLVASGRRHWLSGFTPPPVFLKLDKEYETVKFSPLRP